MSRLPRFFRQAAQHATARFAAIVLACATLALLIQAAPATASASSEALACDTVVIRAGAATLAPPTNHSPDAGIGATRSGVVRDDCDDDGDDDDDQFTDGAFSSSSPGARHALYAAGHFVASGRRDFALFSVRAPPQ